MEIPTDFGSNFWAGVGLAAAVATALATGVATLLSAWWRWRDRAEAEWVVNVERAGGSDKHGDPANKPEISFNLTNVGDGVAFKISVTGEHLKGEPLLGSRRADRRWQRIHPPVPSLRTGDSVAVLAAWESPTDWACASVTIRWFHAPTRRKRRWLGLRSAQLKERFYLRDIAPNPTTET
ncbi:hypothetical protein [Rhodococcus erythropolis]|uniref:hypothetical protein n=1 Tax=Rhodococcus erythropolis TaxID=1833 RepID=UPI000878E494|nr:hypothetical protein [Rhodococcus erythropolis]OFV77042.1 hypothetical protein RERY_22050 [Rhodococcus erythropolis]